VGIDVGSVSINCVVLDEQRELVYEHPYERHFQKTAHHALQALKAVYLRLGRERIGRVAFTGNHGKIIAEQVAALYEYNSITEVLGVLRLTPDAKTIISMGGQNAALYQLSRTNGRWQLSSFAMNGPCASGTGSFIDQQAERLASSLYREHGSFSQEHISDTLADFITLGKTSAAAAPVACRCTVFTKSDMIHLQNKGEPLANIIAGLHRGNAANFISTLVANRSVEDPVVFIGGVASNELQVQAFRRSYAGLRVPPHHASVGALGAALVAADHTEQSPLELASLEAVVRREHGEFPRAPALRLHTTAVGNDAVIRGREQPDSVLRAYLGVDIGSTTTKTVLMDVNKNIVHKQYVQTQGRPIEVTQSLLAGIHDIFGNTLELEGTATTGSGRYVVGDFLDADLIIDEITAHARAAVHWEPSAATVFEIGGQDSKYIQIENGSPLDFDMNKVCAAGTGSFLHELAERCTVFMESDLVSYSQRGARLEDLIAGLCYAVVHNYLNRVVQNRPVREPIMFLGGPSLNKAVVAAFENVLQRPILVPPHREVLGAHGAALSVMEKHLNDQIPESRTADLDSLTRATIAVKEKTCRADRSCHNECKLKIYDFSGRKSVWGGDCGRYERRHTQQEREVNWFKQRERLYAKHLKGRILDPAGLRSHHEVDTPEWEGVKGRPTIGIPQSLYSLQFGVLWTHFWANLGFPVVLTPKTTQQMAMLGIESMTSETCYPIKVFHGHVKSLIGHVGYVFLPTIINVPTPRPEETGFHCPLVQGSQYMVTAALNIHRESLLSPTVCLNDPVDRIVMDLHRDLKRPLGLSRRQVDRAFQRALDAQHTFELELLELGRSFKQSLQPGDLWVAVTGRPYNLHDERLNLHLGQNLAKLGIKAVPHDLLDTGNVDLSDFPNMYWGLGAQILRTAKTVKQCSNAYGMHITNFSCGADSFLEHFYRHVMKPKPYLILELDEHSAVAGMLTRLEAFRGVIHNEHNSAPIDERPMEACTV
jgi:activator of 2-hydroxyglutaryl-CoA dehydratase/predicted nucleotide-binding protein (sugar kinase/HSP70/actin superfamily)